MKLLVLSDLHMEFAHFEPIPARADVVVLAGDINLGTRGINWAKSTFPDVPVIYVAGNHEFYKHHWVKLIVELREAAFGSNVHFLEDDETVIQGTRFLGCTLWTDFGIVSADQRHEAMIEAGKYMTDYRKIRAPRLKPGFRDDYSKLVPTQTHQRFRTSRTFLEKGLATSFDGPTVVVTHHLPHPDSIPDRFLGTPLSAAYASDLTGIIKGANADLWIHGHTHDSFDYVIDATRVICNPRGYPIPGGRFQNNEFKADFSVEI